jgi:hypothetical protein
MMSLVLHVVTCVMLCVLLLPVNWRSERRGGEHGEQCGYEERLGLGHDEFRFSSLVFAPSLSSGPDARLACRQ